MFSASEKRYIVANSITAESKIVDFPDELKFHSHEEPDTLIVPQSSDVAKSNPFCQLYVACSDTDVLLLLLYFYPQICNNIIFHAITREIDVGCNNSNKIISIAHLNTQVICSTFDELTCMLNACENRWLRS